jgi:hypothetical protein
MTLGSPQALEVGGDADAVRVVPFGVHDRGRRVDVRLVPVDS